MIEKEDSLNRQGKGMIVFFDKISFGFCLNTGKRFFLEVSF